MAQPEESAAATPLSPYKRPFVIGVADGTASGKITVCKMIMCQLHDQLVVLVNQDSFYLSLTDEKLQQVHEYNFDHPDAFNTDLLLSCMGKLKQGKPVSIPVYDFKSHTSTEEACKIRTYVWHVGFDETPSKEAETFRACFNNMIDSSSPVSTMKYADVIIPRGGDNNVAIDFIVRHIQTKLAQHDLCKIYNIHGITSILQIRGMHTLIRDSQTMEHDFVFTPTV